MGQSNTPGIWQPLSVTAVAAASTTSGSTVITLPVIGISGYFQVYNDSANIIVANFSGGNTVSVIAPNVTTSTDSVVCPPGTTSIYPFTPYNTGIGDDIAVSGQSVYNPTNVYVAVKTITGTGNLYIQNGGWV
jgi:hypothetical protein